MLGLAAQMLRFRKSSFVATFVALAAGVMILMACGLLVKSGLRYQGLPQRYAGAVAIVAHRDLAVAGPRATPGQVRLMILGEVGLLSLLAAVVGVPAGLAATAWTRDQLVTRGFVPATFTVRGGVLSAGTVGKPRRSTWRHRGGVRVADAVVGLALGDDARMWLGDGTPVTLRVVAIYDRGWGFGDVTLNAKTLTGHTVTGLDDHVLIRTAPGADVGAALADLAGQYPASTVVGTDRLTGKLAQDLAISAWLNKLLIAVLVGYAVLAAANILIMAALARTRELSLLRLVGVTRYQVKRMVHAEQAGLLGVAIAIGVAIAAVTLSSIVNAVAGQRIPYVPALGWITIVGGTVALALVATMLPIGRLLRTPPVEGIGIRE